MNAKHVCVVADHDQPMQPVDSRDNGNAPGRLLGIAALSFSNDGLLRNSLADQIVLANGALGKLIAARTSQSNDQRSDAAMVELERVVQACAINRRRTAVVFRRAKNADRIGRRSLILTCVALNLHVDPAAPCKGPTQQDEDKHERSAEQPVMPLLFGFARHAVYLTYPVPLTKSQEPVGLPFPCSLGPLAPASLSLQGHHDFVRRNGALAQNLPAALAEGEIHDRRRLGARRRAAVDDQRNTIANLVADAASACA